MLLNVTLTVSAGTLRLPHLSTDAASRFCSSSETPMTARSKLREPGYGATKKKTQ